MRQEDTTIEDWLRIERLKISQDKADTFAKMQVETAQVLDEAGRFGMTFSGNTARKIVEARVVHLDSLIKRIVDERREGTSLFPALATRDYLSPLHASLFEMIDAQTSGIPHNILTKLNLQGWDHLPAQYPARLKDTVIVELKKVEFEARILKPDSVGPSVHQTVFGNVGQMAGRDISTQVTVVALLRALEKAIEESPEVPREEKAPLMAKVRELSTNPWIVSLGTGGLLEILKALT